MKRNPLLRAAVCFACFFAVIACNNLHEDSSHSAADITASKSISFAYSAVNTVCEVPEDTASVQISGDITGKRLFLVKANPTDVAIDAARVRYITALNDTPVENAGDDAASSRTAANRKKFFDEDIVEAFSPSQEFDPNEIVATDARATLASGSVAASEAEQSYALGDARMLFVDNNEAISSFEQQRATLCAIGKHCYVWVVDTVSAYSVYAAEYARRFDDMYRMITNVYGNESDEIYMYNGKNFSLADIEQHSATGKKVNIVLSRFVSTGTIGYFYCKDYYVGYPAGSSDARASSNKGKYVYMNTRYAGTESGRKMSYSTLAHEFQHMIMFGQKNIRCNVRVADWFNEMMSMVCEDIMQRQLEIDDAQSPKNRLGRFAASYYLSGASEFISVNGSHLPSYAVLYAFGAYLTRVYGGASFVNKVMQSALANEQAITAAVSEVTGRQTSFTEILRAFVLSFVKDDEASLNQRSEESPFFEGLFDDETQYAYPLAPIDMNRIAQKGSVGEYGMKMFAPADQLSLRPNGFTLHELGEITDNSITITFNKNGAAGQKLFLVIARE